jgi:hypothetical protein
MISLEQVRILEARVEKAVAFIASLRAENASLKDGLLEAELRTEAAEARTAELEGLIKEFQKDQERIEEGIVQALRKLDAFEDAVHAAVRTPAGSGTPPVPTTMAVPATAPAEAPMTPLVSQTTPDEQSMQASERVQTQSYAESLDQDKERVEAGESAAEEPESDQSDGLDIF